MICLYSATKAMAESLRALREDRGVAGIAGTGVGWAELDEVVGLRRWRRFKLKALSEKELLKKYRTMDFDEITGRELDETDRVWKGLKE